MLITVRLDADDFAAALPELLSIYAAAMGYTPSVAHTRKPLWLDHSRRMGFRCVVALDPSLSPGTDEHRPTAAGSAHSEGAAQQAISAAQLNTVVGFCYGYRGALGQWWWGEVARGLGSPANPWLADYFELTELHVRPECQGHGTGETLLRTLVAPAPQRTVLLSTPEGDNRAWRLYRRLGFVDVLRNFLFSGDSRPFAVLGRSLPLDD